MVCYASVVNLHTIPDLSQAEEKTLQQIVYKMCFVIFLIKKLSRKLSEGSNTAAY